MAKDGGLRRLPAGMGESKDRAPMADMGQNKNLDKWTDGQVPENSRLVKFYQNPFGGKPGEKRTIDESMDNGGKFETEAGDQPGIHNHAVGSLGTHKI